MKTGNTLYIISGLGVDHSVFDTIDFGIYKPVHLPWIAPRKKESMKKYALRMAAQIMEPQPTIIGLSFGGMLSVEIAQQIPCSKIILIASAKTYKELPFYYRLIGKMGLHRIVPNFIFSRANAFTHWLFGASTKQEKQLLHLILKNTDSYFRAWAIDALLHWKNIITPPNTVAIHGDNDKIIPVKNVKADYIIKNGGHFMTVQKADQISRLLQDILANN